MSAAKYQRQVRQDPGNSRITLRDCLGLALVGRAQPVITSQYARFLGASRQIACRSLRKLRDHGLVTVHVESLDQESCYSLAPGGARELARQQGLAPEDFPTLRGLGRVGDHHVTTIDVYVTLELALARSKHARLDRFIFEAELRRRVGGAGDALIPDGVAVVCFAPETEPLAFALEVDLGGENPSYVARQKFAPYGELATAGEPLCGIGTWRVLVLVPTERRLHALARAAWTAQVPEGLVYFAVIGDLDDRTILGAVWQTTRLDVDGVGASLVHAAPLAGTKTNCNDGNYSRKAEHGAVAGNFAGGAGRPFEPGGVR